VHNIIQAKVERSYAAAINNLEEQFGIKRDEDEESGSEDFYTTYESDEDRKNEEENFGASLGVLGAPGGASLGVLGAPSRASLGFLGTPGGASLGVFQLFRNRNGNGSGKTGARRELKSSETEKTLLSDTSEL